MNSRVASRIGFTLIELMIVITLIGVLAAVATPSYLKARTKANATACELNRKHLDMAKQLWAQENRKRDEDTPSGEDVLPWLDGQKTPVCPAGGEYSLGTVNARAVCSVHGAAVSGP